MRKTPQQNKLLKRHIGVVDVEFGRDVRDKLRFFFERDISYILPKKLHASAKRDEVTKRLGKGALPAPVRTQDAQMRVDGKGDVF